MKTETHRVALGVLAIAISALAALPASAAVSAAEAARLKTDLTPAGAERAGNADGTIPAWTGGLPKTPPVSGRRVDPFASEKPLFSITAQNMDKYADKLNPGTAAMLKKYPATFRVDVYPSHRTVWTPSWFNEETLKDATSTKLVVDSNGRSHPEGTSGGTPFPIPQSGMEVMFNHLMSYWPQYRMIASNFLLQPDGKRVLVSTFDNNVQRLYGSPERANSGLYWKVRTTTTNPPIRTGEGIVALYYEDGTKDSSWVYLPGQRRVRKLPTSCCDTPAPFAAGIITFDEIPGTFSGSMQRFDWKLIGKKEMYVPYNSNRTSLPTIDQVLLPSHLKPDYVRWELHRVWVVEAKLKAGDRHVSARSVYYIDEDSWQGLLAERYDAQGELARTGFAVPLLLTDTGSFVPSPWGWYDMHSGAAFVANFVNESPEQVRVIDKFSPTLFSPDAMAAEGVR